MTVLEAYRRILADTPSAATSRNGHKARGRAILANWKAATSEVERQHLLATLDDPAKSLIEAELASGRL